jgi:prepilin-type N-terminal cleavage/methylation domain-containing protein
MLTKFTKNNEKGFTLIELMIVIAIIGILAAIAIPQFSAYRQRSYNSAANADLRNAATAQEAYYVDSMTYTSAVGNLIGTYGLYLSQGVVFNVIRGNTSTYHMEAYHTSGSRTYSITGPGGSVQ